MLKLVRPTARQRGAIAQTQMRAIIQNRHIVFSKQPGDSSKRSAKPAVEKHGVFASEKFCNPSLEFPVKVGHSGKHRRTTGAEAVRFQCLLCCENDLGMIGQTKIIVGTKVNHRAW